MNVASSDFESHESSVIKLIDFGVSIPYLDESGNHIKYGDTESFMGNFFFASKNALQFKTQSRRDDLISLSYLMIFLVNGNMKWLLNLIKDRELSEF